MALDWSAIPTSTLRAFRDALAAGRIEAPISAGSLRLLRLNMVAEHAEELRELSAQALVAVIDACLSERARASGSRSELVWTGPEGKGSLCRDTAVVVQTLFQEATESVLIAGFRFDNGKDLLRSLHQAMKDRNVSCVIYGDTESAPGFERENWPFGAPYPSIFAFVPPEGVFSSLHAKCVIADHRRVLVTSANFTDRGQTRNIEVGILIEDGGLACALEQQLLTAQREGFFRSVSGGR